MVPGRGAAPTGAPVQADDRDGDGRIALEELVARASDLLHRRDRDGDGALSAEELRPRRRPTQARRRPARAMSAARGTTGGRLRLTAKAAFRAVAQADVAAVAAHDRAGDGEPQADAAGLRRARTPPAARTARTRARTGPPGCRGRRPRSRSAALGPAAPGGHGRARHSARRSRAGCAAPGAAPPAGRRRAVLLGPANSIAAPRSARSAAVLSTSAARSTTRVASRRGLLAGEGQRRLDHVLHLVERRQDPGPGLLVVDELGAQAQRGDRRAQIVADRRQHPGAVVDEAAQPRLHPVERRHRRPAPRSGRLGQQRAVPRRGPARRPRPRAAASAASRGGPRAPPRAPPAPPTGQARPGWAAPRPGGGWGQVSTFSQLPSSSCTDDRAGAGGPCGRRVPASAAGRSSGSRGSKPIRLPSGRSSGKSTSTARPSLPSSSPLQLPRDADCAAATSPSRCHGAGVGSTREAHERAAAGRAGCARAAPRASPRAGGPARRCAPAPARGRRPARRPGARRRRSGGSGPGRPAAPPATISTSWPARLRGQQAPQDALTSAVKL